MIIIFKIFFWILTAYYIFCALYIFVYAVAGIFYKAPRFPKSDKYKRFAIFVPAYKADAVIEESAANILRQDYPDFDLIVIADSLSEETLDRLKSMPIIVVEFSDENRTKALALNTAMSRLTAPYDIALILDSDNVIRDNDYLKKLNDAFRSGLSVIQTHRTAKNTNTALAILDAASEEINNHIFRRGHVALGLSSALIGSAMAFDYTLFKDRMKTISSSGEDKELEMQLLKARIRTKYLDDLIVLDEKTQKADAFVNQRARWIANQVMQARMNIGEGFRQLFRGNVDFFDKVIQQCLLPRALLIGTSCLFTLAAVIFLPPAYYVIWLAVVGMVCISMLIGIPYKMYHIRMLKALLYLPVGVFLMLYSLFRMKGAAKTFQATKHGIIKKNNSSLLV